MNTDEFFAEAKRLNLRMLGTPEETRAALDAKDAEIERLRAEATRAYAEGRGEQYKDDDDGCCVHCGFDGAEWHWWKHSTYEGRAQPEARQPLCKERRNG